MACLTPNWPISFQIYASLTILGTLRLRGLHAYDLQFDDPLPKHEETVLMSSGDSLQDWSSDSRSSHQTEVRSPAVQILQLQLAQAQSAFS